MKLTDPKETIIELKRVVAELGLRPLEVFEMVEKAKIDISLSSVRRVLADGSEDSNFDFKNVVMPIANLFIDFSEEGTDSPQVSLMKELLLAKKEIIERQENEISDLKLQLAEEKNKHHDRIEKINDEHIKEHMTWMHQIELKDARMDKLFTSNEKKDAKIDAKESKIVELEDRIDRLLADLQKMMDKCGNCQYHKE